LLDLFRPQVQLNTGSVPGGPEQVQLFVNPLTPGPCHPIPGLKATLDGVEMTRLRGKVEGENGYDRDCNVYEFTMDAARVEQKPTNTLVITDGTNTFTMDVAHLFDPRTVTPSATTVKPKDSVTLAWSPGTDVLAPKGDFGIELKGGDKPVFVRRTDLVIGAGTVTFTMPEGVSGEVTATVFGTMTMQPAVTKCEGAHTCGVSRAYDVPPFQLTVGG
jgi:hypothetical protein